MEKIEKVTIDKKKVKEFVDRTKETEKWDKLVLFSTEIDGGKFEASLDINQFEGDWGPYQMYYFSAEAREFFFDDEEINVWGPDDYDGLAFEHIEEIDEEFYETLFEICHRKTDEYIDTLNKQQELIEQAIKDGVEGDTDEFESLVEEIMNMWWNLQLYTYEEGMQSGLWDFKQWLGDFLEKNKTVN